MYVLFFTVDALVHRVLWRGENTHAMQTPRSKNRRNALGICCDAILTFSTRSLFINDESPCTRLVHVLFLFSTYYTYIYILFFLTNNKTKSIFENNNCPTRKNNHVRKFFEKALQDLSQFNKTGRGRPKDSKHIKKINIWSLYTSYNVVQKPRIQLFLN